MTEKKNKFMEKVTMVRTLMLLASMIIGGSALPAYDHFAKTAYVEKVQTQVAMNTMQLYEHELSVLKKERRALRSDIRKDPKDEATKKEFDEVEDDIEEKKDEIKVLKEKK